ncbi:MAG: glycosyltransferase [Promethearchaeota archaeon]
MNIITKDKKIEKSEEVVDVSITTINWNVPDKLEACIISFLNTYDNLNYEWFIIDNNSRGNDFDKISNKFSNNPRIKFIKNGKNEGLSVLNKFIDKIRGRYWVFLDPDTLQKGKPIEELLKFMDSHPDAGIASAKQFNLDNSPLNYYGTRFTLKKVFYTQTIFGRAINKLFFSSNMDDFHYYKRINFTKVSQIDQVPFACTIERVEIIRNEGYVIDEDLSFFYNDVDLCKRIRDKNYKIYLVPSAEIYHDFDSAYRKADKIWFFMTKKRNLILFFRKHHKNKVFLLKLLLLLDSLILAVLSLIRSYNRKIEFSIKLKLIRNILKW